MCFVLGRTVQTIVSKYMKLTNDDYEMKQRELDL